MNNRKRESDICKADYSKNSLILEELINERTNLEKSAKQLTGTRQFIKEEDSNEFLYRKIGTS